MYRPFNSQKFYQIVTKDFYKAGGEACVNSVKKTWNTVKEYGKTGEENNNKKISHGCGLATVDSL